MLVCFFRYLSPKVLTSSILMLLGLVPLNATRSFDLVKGDGFTLGTLGPILNPVSKAEATVGRKKIKRVLMIIKKETDMICITLISKYLFNFISTSLI